MPLLWGDDDEIGLETLRLTARAPSTTGDDPYVIRLPSTLSAAESKAIQAALLASGGNRTKVAALLEVPRSALYVKLAALASATAESEPDDGG